MFFKKIYRIHLSNHEHYNDCIDFNIFYFYFFIIGVRGNISNNPDNKFLNTNY